jgi:hypothetical protein
MSSYSEKKENLKAQLTEVGKDMRESKVKQRINNIEKVDGKISANFSVSGLPHKEKEGMYPDSYRDWPKIFNDVPQFTQYAEKFLGATDEELIKICNEK